MKVREGSVVGQVGHCLCGMGSSRRMGEKGGSAKDVGRGVIRGRQKMGEQRMKRVD